MSNNEFSNLQKTKKKRCPKGTRRDKSGNCVPTNKPEPVVEVEPVPVVPLEPVVLVDKKKRCPKGTRRDKSGNCVPTNAAVAKVPSPAKIQSPSPAKPHLQTKKRCPKGTRRDKNGNCVSTKKPSPREPSPEKPKEPSPIKPREPSPIKPKEPSPIKPKEPSPIKPREPSPIKPREPSPIKPREPLPKKPYGDWLPMYNEKHKKWWWIHQKTGEKSWQHPITFDAKSVMRIPLYPRKNEWTPYYADKQQKWWWYNNTTGEKTWQNPYAKNPVADIKPVALVKPIITKSIQKPFVAVIVPFRDLHKAQERKKHLERFVPEMSAFLQKSGKPFKIYIVEQSDDDCKFNRGKLLNIGYKLAAKDGAEVFVFHDVDLIPSDNLLPYYTNVPSEPVHIARVWNRYSGNKSYFGGVVAFSKKQYSDINGFPNNYWGWGGEDDELYLRVKEIGMNIDFPTEGTFIDMENMNLQEKLRFLKTNQGIKCMNKYELLADHTATWTSNGLSNLKYDLIDESAIGNNSYKYVVDLMDKEHCNEQLCVLPKAKR